jgi:uncharacterized pyridoxal phosphate-containing UPF0001 family protein
VSSDNDISHNLRDIRHRIEQTCHRAGRASDDVTIIGVTKTKPVDMLRAAVDAGIHDLGENYVQELVETGGEA